MFPWGSRVCSSNSNSHSHCFCLYVALSDAHCSYWDFSVGFRRTFSSPVRFRRCHLSVTWCSDGCVIQAEGYALRKNWKTVTKHVVDSRTRMNHCSGLQRWAGQTGQAFEVTGGFGLLPQKQEGVIQGTLAGVTESHIYVKRSFWLSTKNGWVLREAEFLMIRKLPAGTAKKKKRKKEKRVVLSVPGEVSTEKVLMAE